MEAFVAGYVAPDQRMIEMHKAKADIHRLVAAERLKCLPEAVTEGQRERAKGVVFGLNYGRGVRSLAEDWDESLAEAQAYVDSYFTMFKGLKEHHERVRKLVDEAHEIQTPFKRKRHLYGVPLLKAALARGFYSKQAEGDARRALAEMYRMAINDTVQSPANDILGLASIRIHERFRAAGMKAQQLIYLHDAWDGEAPEEEMEDAVRIVKEEMERAVPEFGGATFETSIEIGRYWGDRSIIIKGLNG
jgi:DNA polymerase-1